MLFRHDSAENIWLFCGVCFWRIQGVKPPRLLFCREKQNQITKMTSKQTGGNMTAGLRERTRVFERALEREGEGRSAKRPAVSQPPVHGYSLFTRDQQVSRSSWPMRNTGTSREGEDERIKAESGCGVSARQSVGERRQTAEEQLLLCCRSFS